VSAARCFFENAVFCAFVSSIEQRGKIGCRTVEEHHPQRFQNEVRNTMTDRIDGSRNLASVESRTNLIFLLQELAGIRENKRGPESPVSDEQIETRQAENGTVS
jgi:hypothetical protein